MMAGLMNMTCSNIRPMECPVNAPRASNIPNRMLKFLPLSGVKTRPKTRPSGMSALSIPASHIPWRWISDPTVAAAHVAVRHAYTLDRWYLTLGSKF